MTDLEILRDLVSGARCACTAPKRKRMALCKGCYGRLPEGTQRALYHREDYPATYRRCLVFLGLTEPAPTPHPTPQPITQS